jgi:3-methyladenine DNA glycosylase AlkD
MTHSLVKTIRASLAEVADPTKAPQMQAYMKSSMPYRGVSSPTLKQICRTTFKAHPLATAPEWQRVVLDLWRSASFREERYAAILLTQYRAYREFQTFSSRPMLEEMIVTGAWWDFVDTLAGRNLGDILRTEPRRMKPLMRRWSRDADMWKRRSAILCQLGFKRETDLTLLYDCIEPNLSHKDFFIRKAIGWALRQYAWTDPKEVRRYVKANKDRLSGLSVREALKNICGPATAGHYDVKSSLRTRARSRSI